MNPPPTKVTLSRSLGVTAGVTAVQVRASVLVKIVPAFPTATNRDALATVPTAMAFSTVPGTVVIGVAAIQVSPSALSMVDPSVAMAKNPPLTITPLRFAANPGGRVDAGIHAVTPGGL